MTVLELLHGGSLTYCSQKSELNSLYLLQYAEKIFICRKEKTPAQQMLESICANDKKAVYQHIVKSEMDVNAISKQALSGMFSCHSYLNS
jgi:hypothetical protein